MNELGETVKARRELLGLTQRALAEELGIQASYVSFLERGLRRPSIGLIQRMADALVVDRHELLTLVHPVLLKGNDLRSPKGSSPSSKRLTSKRVLLRRYHLTKNELRVIEGLNLFGRTFSLKQFIAVLALVRNIQSSSKRAPRSSRS